MLEFARLEESGARGSGEGEDSPAPRRAAEAVGLARWLEGFLDQQALHFPRPPATALEICQLSQRADASIDHIAALVQREPLLAGQVLQLANSAYYRGDAPTTTIKQALVRVGLTSARDLVMEAAMQLTVIRAPGYDLALESVRRHSAAVAWLARLVAHNTPLEPEGAFVAGLLHDVGLSVGLVALAEFEKQAKLRGGLTPARWAVVCEAHERLGQRLLRSWGLEPALTQVVGRHHSLRSQGPPHPLVAVLVLAEHLAADGGWGMQHLPSSAGAIPEPDGNCEGALGEELFEALQLTPRHYELLKRDAEPMLRTLARQFERR